MKKTLPALDPIDSIQKPPETINDEANDQANKNLTTQEKKRLKIWPQKKIWQIVLISCLIFLVILGMIGAVGAYTYRVTKKIETQGQSLKTEVQTAFDVFKAQNLPETELKLTASLDQLRAIKITYSQLSFYEKFPLAKKYYIDGLAGLEAADHGLQAAIIAIKAITPYADVLGFEGEDSFTGGTAEDRINLLLQTLDKVTPQFDEIQNHLDELQQNLATIDPNDYPEEIRGITLKAQLISATQAVNQGIKMFDEFRPVIEQLPSIAGGKGERKKYLILFQNDNELRPTGGFLTAYSVIYMENGKVSPEKSDDIYELDKKFYERIDIPESLGRYLTTEKYWNLRDMNISPDFKVSMDTFFQYYQTIRGEPDNIDGIIAVDTTVLTRLLEILGPTEVPGYGTFSAELDTRCDCPQVVYALSEIITRPTPYLREDRKGILGPMMQSILVKTYSAPKEKWSELFAMAWEAIKGRHVQMYFIDEQAQLATENIGGAGRLTPDLAKEGGGDFLAIVDANLGGAKSNLFTSYEVSQVIDGPVDGKITKSVEITYRNSRAADNCNLEAGKLCLNSTLADWHRLYLPLGSELIELQGFTQEPKLYEELGFQVIDGFFKLEPEGVAKIKLSYTVPYTLTDYHLFIWKQGGIDPYETVVDVNGNQTQLTIDQDQTYTDIF